MDASVTLPERTALMGAVLIPLNLIRANPWNRQVNEKALPELAESVRQHGVLQPVLVRPAPDAKPGAPLYELVAGERRWRAGQMAGLAELPALVREMDDLQVIELMLVENLQREDLHALDEAAGYDRLLRKDSGPQSLRGFATVEDLAARIGKSRSYIVQRLTLLKLCATAVARFRAGELSFSLALRIARLPNHADQEKATPAILQGWGGNPMSARDADEYIHRTFMLELDRAPFKITDAELVPAAGSCRECPKRTGASPDLFADVAKGDTCTDAACYASKEEAHRARVKAQAELKGMPVLSGAAAKKVMPTNYGTPKGYLELDKVHYNLDPKKPLRKLLGKADVKPVLVESPHNGELVEMVAEAQAVAALKAAGVIKTAKIPSSGASERAAEEKRERENTWRRAVAEEIGNAARGEKGLTPAYRSQLIARVAVLLWEEVGHDTRTRLGKLLGWPPVRSRHDNTSTGPTAEQHIRGLDDGELCRYLTLASVAKYLHVGSYQMLDKPAELLAVADELGVDADAIKASLRKPQRVPAKGAKATALTPETALAAALKKAKAGGKAPRSVAFRHPETGETWSGRGLQPAWLKAAVASGKSLKDFDTRPAPAAHITAAGAQAHQAAAEAAEGVGS